MKVPYVALDRAFARNRDRYMEIAEEVWASGQLHGGKYVKELEEAIAIRCNRKYGIAVASCTDALYFALLANRIGRGDEVIVPSYSFIASASCIKRAGAKPVFADIDPSSYMIDNQRIKKHITTRTKAILAVNLFGRAIQIEEIELFAEKHSLKIIEDAAQSFGAFTFDKRAVGSMGEASCISFDPVKNLGSFGTGGMVVTDDEDIKMKIQTLRNHGRLEGSDKSMDLGAKSKLPEAEAAMLLVSLEDFDGNNKRRFTIATRYWRALYEIDDRLHMPCYSQASIWHKFIIMADDKEGLRKHLADNGIETKNIYPRPLFKEPVFSKHKYKGSSWAEITTRSNLALPIFPDMTDEEVEYVISMIKKFYQ